MHVQPLWCCTLCHNAAMKHKTKGVSASWTRRTQEEQALEVHNTAGRHLNHMPLVPATEAPGTVYGAQAHYPVRVLVYKFLFKTMHRTKTPSTSRVILANRTCLMDGPARGVYTTLPSRRMARKAPLDDETLVTFLCHVFLTTCLQDSEPHDSSFQRTSCRKGPHVRPPQH